jgi:hypothetical protein
VLDVVGGWINFATGVIADEVNVRAFINDELQAVKQDEAAALLAAGSTGQVPDTAQFKADKAALDEIQSKLLGSPNMFESAKS